MVPIGCLEMSVRNYHYTLRNIPEEHRYGYWCVLILSVSRKAMDVQLSVFIVFCLLWQGFSFRVHRVELMMNELVLVFFSSQFFGFVLPVAIALMFFAHLSSTFKGLIKRTLWGHSIKEFCSILVCLIVCLFVRLCCFSTNAALAAAFFVIGARRTSPQLFVPV